MAALARALADAVPANTQRAYDAQNRRFIAWCDDRGIPSVPCDEQMLATYLCHRASTCRMATVEGSRSAIVAMHLAAGYTSPAGELVAKAMHGLRRRYGVAKRQVAPLTEDVINSIRALADDAELEADNRSAKPRWLRLRENAGLVGVLGEGGLRISEAAALKWRDVSAAVDGTGRLAIARSKGDQQGEGATVAISSRTLSDLEQLRPYPPHPGMPVFGLCVRALRDRVKAACKAAGVAEWRAISGHSGRVGMAQRMVANGAPAHVVVRQGRWKSDRQVANYTRELSAGVALDYL